MEQLKMTKKQRKDRVRELLNEVPYLTPFNEIQVKRLNLLTGWTYSGYKKVMNPNKEFKMEPCIYVVDRKEIQSWLKAIDGYYKENRELLRIKQALRMEIADTMKRLKQHATHCDICNGTKNLSVDHKSISFDHIAMTYINNTPDIKIGCKPNNVGNYLLNDQQRQEWLLFHDTMIENDHQILCRSCNSKKG
jgi:hypothetical protein